MVISVEADYESSGIKDALAYRNCEPRKNMSPLLPTEPVPLKTSNGVTSGRQLPQEKAVARERIADRLEARIRQDVNVDNRQQNHKGRAALRNNLHAPEDQGLSLRQGSRLRDSDGMGASGDQ